MAAIYKRTDSGQIWIRYKSAEGKWKAKRTGYRWDNPGERRQAELLARQQSEIESTQRLTGGDVLDEWVLPWIITKYGGLATTTPDRYKRMWRTLGRWLESVKITASSQLRREHASDYLLWRLKTASRNAALQEVKFLGMVLGEAEERGYISKHPLRKLGWKKERAAEKEIWSDEHLQKAQAHFERYKSHWMLCTFYLGMYQACRLRQCALPIRGIRFDLNVIQYPPEVVKGLEGYSQPIDPRLRPILERLVKAARDQGLSTLCVIPWDASLRLRQSFDRAGLKGFCHHGLRATWITRAAENGIPESQAMAFCHHSSREVHRIYKRLSVVGIAHVPAQMKYPDFSSGT